MDVCVDGESEERSSKEPEHSSSPLNLRGGFSQSSTPRFGMQGMQGTRSRTRLPTPPGGGRVTPAGAPRQVVALRQVVRLRGRRLACLRSPTPGRLPKPHRRLACFPSPTPQAYQRLDAYQDRCLRRLERPTVAFSLVQSSQRHCMLASRWLAQKQCVVGSRSRCLGRPSHALSLLHSSTRSTASLLQMAAGDRGGRAGGGRRGRDRCPSRHPTSPTHHCCHISRMLTYADVC